MKKEWWYIIITIIILFIIFFGLFSTVGNAINEPYIMQRGDLNKNGIINGDDVDLLVDYIFRGGPAPDPLELANVDGKDPIGNILDLNYLIAYVYPSTAPVALQTGDLNEDGLINQADVDFLIADIFQGGPSSDPIELSDINGDGNSATVLDLNYLGQYVSNNGPAPALIPRGDLNEDGDVDEADVDALVNYIFRGIDFSASNEMANIDGNNGVGVLDLNYLIAYVYPRVPPPGFILNEIECRINSDCPANQQCVDSTCVETVCVDGDEGLDYYVKGITTGSQTLEDFCVSATKLSEALCNNDGREAYAQYECPNGCSNGACNVEAERTSCEALVEGGPKIQPETRVETRDARIHLSLSSTGPLKETATIGGESYTFELVTSSDSSASIRITNNLGFSQTRELNEGDSRKIQGIFVELISSDEDNVNNILSAEIAAGDETIKYCNPLTLTYDKARSVDEGCLEDYQCVSNVCIEGKCTALRAQLEEQTNLLKRIWCAIINPVNVLKRDDVGETQLNNDYLECVYGSVECIVDSDCSSNQQCANNKCVSPLNRPIITQPAAS